MASKLSLKGTVQRDFLTPVFFTKRFILVSIDMPKSDFEICRIFAELFVLKKHLPPQLSSFMPCVGKIPRPSRYWLGENIKTVSRPNFSPR
jgi:hypothetical protein